MKWLYVDESLRKVGIGVCINNGGKGLVAVQGFEPRTLRI